MAARESHINLVARRVPPSSVSFFTFRVMTPSAAHRASWREMPRYAPLGPSFAANLSRKNITPDTGRGNPIIRIN